jgi:serine/threonine protein kinase
VRQEDSWVYANPDSSAPGLVQGFKVHVAAVPANALSVLDVVVPVCVEHDTAFKVASDPMLFYDLLSKHQARGASGKFMTIYPATQQGFQTVLEQLHRETKDLPLRGPRILSDRQYKDSTLLYYRYGGFHPPRRVEVDGTHATFLISPDGEYVRDERLPYFQLPAWVEDPFGGGRAVAAQDEVLLRERYLVEGALTFSNAGGLYYGTDTVTGAEVLIKEARPFTNYWTIRGRAVDAVYFLRREHRMLERLAKLDMVPQACAPFDEGGHTFLVQERLRGVNFRRYWARPEILLAPYVGVPGRIEKWSRIFKQVADALIGMVLSIHDEGVVLGDLSPNNIVINPDTLQMWFVDLESATTDDDDAGDKEHAALWITQGFAHQERAPRKEVLPKDDFYALGMTLYSALVPIQALLTLNPAAERAFMAEFVSLGVPVEVEETISCLLRGAPEEAKAVLAGFRPDQVATGLAVRTSHDHSAVRLLQRP